MSASSGSDSAMARNSLQMLHIPVLSLEWTSEEEKLLEEALKKYPSEKYVGLFRYMKVAAMLPDKNTRDVAMKMKWALQKQQQQQQLQPPLPAQPQAPETGKRRKADDIPVPPPPPILMKKKEKKDKPTELKPAPLGVPGPPLAMRPSHPMGTPVPMPMQMYCPPPPIIESDDSSCYQAIGGTAGKLLEQNDHLIAKCRFNLCGGKVQENIELLCQLRDNVTDVLNGMTSMPGIMSQMPPLPVKLNIDLCDQLLPKRLTPPVAAAADPPQSTPVFPPPPGTASTPTPPSSKPSTSTSPPEQTPPQPPASTS